MIHDDSVHHDDDDDDDDAAAADDDDDDDDDWTKKVRVSLELLKITPIMGSDVTQLSMDLPIIVYWKYLITYSWCSQLQKWGMFPACEKSESFNFPVLLVRWRILNHNFELDSNKNNPSWGSVKFFPCIPDLYQIFRVDSIQGFLTLKWSFGVWYPTRNQVKLS